MQSDEVTEVTDNNSDERSNSELQNSQTPSPPTPSVSLAQNASALAMAAQLSASNNAQAAALGLGKYTISSIIIIPTFILRRKFKVIIGSLSRTVMCFSPGFNARGKKKD